MRALSQALPRTETDSDKSSAWHACTSLATEQDGIVARRQLLGAGVSRHQIDRWARRGLIYRRHWGVYSVGHPAVTPRGLLRAALLTCGEDAFLSHRAASYLWDLVDAPPETVDVTLVGRQCRSRAGLRAHQVQEMDPRDLCRRNGFPATSPARTIIDQAARETLEGLDRLIAEARVKRLVRPGELEAALERAGHRAGTAQIRALLAAEGGPVITRSEAERILRRLLRDARLAQPLCNARVAGYEVDFLWPHEKLIVEFDSWQFHGHRRAFENDRRKDVVLAGEGYLVLRFTWRQLTEEPLAVIAAVAAALARRRV